MTRDETVTNSVLFLHNGWENGPQLPVRVYNHACVVTSDNKLYLSGGRDSSHTRLSSLYSYTREGGWVREGDMTGPRSHHGMSVVKNLITVTGGWDGDDRLDTIERFSGDKWVMSGRLERERSAHVQLAIPENRVTCGGE